MATTPLPCGDYIEEFLTKRVVRFWRITISHLSFYKDIALPIQIIFVFISKSEILLLTSSYQTAKFSTLLFLNYKIHVGLTTTQL